MNGRRDSPEEPYGDETASVRRLAGNLERTLQEAHGFWLGLIFVDGETAARQVREIATAAAAAAGATLTVRPAHDPSEVGVITRALIERPAESTPSLVDWSALLEEDTAQDAIDDAVQLLYDSYTELQAAHPAGLIVLSLGWTYQAWIREAIDRVSNSADALWTDRIIEARVRSGPVHPPGKNWEPTDWLGPDWLTRAPAQFRAMYEAEGAGSSLSALAPRINALAATGEPGWSELRQLFTLAATVAHEARRGGVAFQSARLALQIADEDAWNPALRLARDLMWDAPGSIEGWACALAGETSATTTTLLGNSQVFEMRRLDALDRVAKDLERSDRGRNDPLVLRLNRLRAHGYASKGDSDRAVAILRDTFARCERSSRIGPSHPFTERVRSDLAAIAEGLMPIGGELSAGHEPPDRVEQTLEPVLSIAELVQGSGASADAVATVLQRIHPAVALRASPGLDVTSRLGGRALMPAGSPWPNGPAGWPLIPIAVVDLTEMPSLEPLPSEGILAFYWDREGWPEGDTLSSSRVVWIPTGTPFAEIEDPQGAEVTFPALPVTGGLVQAVDEIPELVHDLSSEDDRRAVTRVLHECGVDTVDHQLLGAPGAIQGPVFDDLAIQLQDVPSEVRATFTASELSGKGWRLLARIREDEHIIFADDGVLYFLILNDDLHKQRFDRVAVILRSH